MTSSLTGAWRLVHWTGLKNGAPDGWPMGEDAIGQIIYAPEGRMSAFLARADFAKGGAAPGPETMIAYAGTWRIERERVIHHVEHATLPHWIGRELVRIMKPEDAQLHLLTEPEYSKSGNTYEHRLVWERFPES